MINLHLLALGFAVAASAASLPPAQKVSFPTKDGWTISADFRPAKKHGAVLVLVHGVAASKAEWAGFTERLAAKGVGTLAIDLRGHDESKKGPPGSGDYTTFDAVGEWPRAVADLDAAVEWLKAKGIPDEKIALGGASIGANLASVEAATRPKTPFLLLLSSAPQYRGVPLHKPLTRTLAGASPPDQGADMTLKPLAAVPGVETFEAPAGHGVQMFADPATLDKVVTWVVSAAKR